VPSFNYYRRIASAYLLGGQSHLNFWHETPEENPNASINELGQYYMSFREKADYVGPYDTAQIPLLDYRGKLGPQYNPIAIAQYGLGNYNLFRRNGDRGRRDNVFLVADWLAAHLERTRKGSRFGITTSTGSIATACEHPGTRHWRKGREFRFW
jgi:hypothetical protein